MRKRRLGRTEIEVSEIGFGSLEIGRPWGLPVEGDFKVPEEREVGALLDHALVLGINFIDTAPAYMLSEERIGKFLKHRRKEFYLGTKCGEDFDGTASKYDFSTHGTLRSIESSLRRLQTDYVDLVEIHCGPEEVATIRKGEVLQGMLRAKKEGKVRWVGASCNAPGALGALEMGSYDVLQLPYSLLDRAIEKEILPSAREKGIGIIIREPLERGRLTDKVLKTQPDNDPAAAKVRDFLKKLESGGVRLSLARLAIQFILRNPSVSTVLVGTRSVLHLEDAITAASLPPDAKLLAAAEILSGL